MSYYYLNIILILVCILYMILENTFVGVQKRIVYIVLVVCSILIFAFRPEDTKDTFGYIESFREISKLKASNISIFQKYDGYEIGYIYLIKAIRSVTDNYRVLFLIVTGVGLPITLKTLHRLSSSSWVLSIDDIDIYDFYQPVGATLALYITNYGLLYNGITVRAGLSTGIGLYAFLLLKEGRIKRGSIYFVISFLLQRTSFLLLVAYLVYRFFPVLKQKTHLIIWGIIGALMFSGIASKALVFIISWFMEIISRFGISGYAAFLSSLDVAVGLQDIYKWLIYGLLILICDQREENQRYLNIVLIGALVVVFMHDVRAASRAYDIFYLFMIPLMSDFYYGKMERTTILSSFRRTITYSVLFIGAVVLLRTCF